MTVPTNNEEAEALNLLKYAAGVDHPTFGQGFFFTQAAVDSLISDVRRLPVSGDNAELIKNAHEWLEVVAGARPDAQVIRDLLKALELSSCQNTDLIAWKDAATVILEHIKVEGRPALTVIETMTRLAALSASQPREAAPSDTDKEALIEEAERVYDGAVLHDDVDYEVGLIQRLGLALARSSHPVQVEVSDDEWGVYSEREGNFYHVQPPTYENAAHEAELVGEAHRPVLKTLGAEMSNAWNHGRRAALGGGDQ